MTPIELTRHFLSLSEGCPTVSPLMAHRRAEVRELLERKPLPKHGPEHYTRFDLAAFADAIPAKAIHYDITPYRLLDDSLLIDNAEETDTDDYYIGRLSRFAERYPDRAKLFGSQRDLRARSVPALTDLFVSDAEVVYIKPDRSIDLPLETIDLIGQGLSARHLLIICDRGSSARMIRSHRNLPERGATAFVTTELYLAECASLELYDEVDQTDGTLMLHNLHATLDRDAHLALSEIVTHPERLRINLFIDLLGAGTDLRLDGLAVLREENLCDIWSNIYHRTTDGKTDELFKYTVDDQAVGSFSGMIYVGEGAIRTDAEQHNRNLLLSPEAKMYAKPQLEIYADDVRCSHGLATGLLDEEALFYMQQRGIPVDEAHEMLTAAFLHDVLIRIPDPRLRELFTGRVDRRLSRSSDLQD